jgi:ATP-binding cassette subfamily B protein
MTSLADVADMYQRSMAAIERAMALLDTPTSIPYEGQHFSKASVRGEVRLEDVGFSYATTGATPTLHGISLTIAAGQTTAFVGSTG